MAEESPIVNRLRNRFIKNIRETSIRLRFPRRGRLRLLLALVLIIAGSKAAGIFIKSIGRNTASSGFTALADTANVTDRKIGNKLSVRDVADLLGSARPRLNSGRDTITGRNGKRVVAYYSLDSGMQVFIRDILKSYKPRYGAAVVMDPESGRVLAVTSYRNDTVPDLGSTLFLRAVFPAASIYKTVTSAAAIEKAHYTAQTSVPVTGRNHTLYKFQLKKEIDCAEQVPFEEAFAKSMNPVFARVGMHVLGRNVLEDYSRRFGFNAGIPFELFVDTSRASVPDDTTYEMAEFASGFNRHTSLSPLHGALIASAAAMHGVMPLPRLVDSVCRAGDGERLYASSSGPWRTCMADATAGELRAMMNTVVRKGTARKSFRCLKDCYWSPELDCGGKTGSIEADTLGKVDWFIGYAKKLDGSGGKLAVAIVTTHGAMWTVHSSYIASEIFRKYCRPEPKALAVHPVNTKENQPITAVPGKIRG